MINEQYDRAKQILEANKEGHNQLAELLITREVIYAEDVERIFGKRPWTSRTQEIIEANEALKAEREKQAEEALALDNMPEEVRRAQEEYERSTSSTADVEPTDNNNDNEQKPE